MQHQNNIGQDKYEFLLQQSNHLSELLFRCIKEYDVPHTLSISPHLYQYN